jgi:hypothetical protein
MIIHVCIVVVQINTQSSENERKIHAENLQKSSEVKVRVRKKKRKRK